MRMPIQEKKGGARMIICLCHAISSSKLEKLKEEGCESLRQLQKQCSAGSSCGSCVADLKRALKEKDCCRGQAQDDA